MPKINWREMDDIVHKVKNILTKIAYIELKSKDDVIKRKAKEIREEASSELEELKSIIFNQVNGDD